MTLYIYSNCQGLSLSDILQTSSEFNRKYEIKECMVFVASEKEIDDMFKRLEEGCEDDVIVYQSISEGYRGWKCSSNRLNQMDNITRIRLTNAYYLGYSPRESYLYDLEGKHIVESGIDIQDMNLLGQWLYRNTSFHDSRILQYATKAPEKSEIPVLPDFSFISDMIEDPLYYTPEQSWHEHHLSLARMDYRDALFQADVSVTDFIRKNFQERRLFHTFNHPDVHVMHDASRQIMEILDLDPDTLASPDDIPDRFDFMTFPIYRSTQDNLSLQFESPRMYRRYSQDYTPTEEMDRLSLIYKSLDPEILLRNIHRYLDNKVNTLY